MQGTTPVTTSLPNLVCADDTAHAAATMATARRTAALDAIASCWAGDGVECKQSKLLLVLVFLVLLHMDRRGIYSQARHESC